MKISQEEIDTYNVAAENNARASEQNRQKFLKMRSDFEAHVKKEIAALTGRIREEIASEVRKQIEDLRAELAAAKKGK